MSYFKTSYATLQSLAQYGRYEDVAGFLVLARHASGLAHAGFEPYKLSGAGVNGIHDKVGVSEEVARGVMERLQHRGLIRATSLETRKAFLHGRWEIFQGDLDLDLPHAITDTNKAGVESALRRIKRVKVLPAYKNELGNATENELRLDALMVMLASYRHTSMTLYGGISPSCIRREWTVESQTPKLGGFRWGADPAKHAYNTTYPFMRESMDRSISKNTKDSQIPKEAWSRFWNAWTNLDQAGLVYEAVCLYDKRPSSSVDARLTLTVRVNDYHAGSASKTGDPSLLRTLETHSGSQFGFYTPPINERDEPESMWVVLPDKRGELVGVWRPRFRCSNQDTGTWLMEENERIDSVLMQLEDASPLD